MSPLKWPQDQLKKQMLVIVIKYLNYVVKARLVYRICCLPGRQQLSLSAVFVCVFETHPARTKFGTGADYHKTLRMIALTFPFLFVFLDVC